MIIDTNVLIWYMRGDKNAFKTIEKLNGSYTSVVTYIELVQGLRNKAELIELRKAFRVWNTKFLYKIRKFQRKLCFISNGII